MLAIQFFFEIQYVDQFCLKSFSPFSTEGLRAESSCMYRSGAALLTKLRHCFIKHNGEEQGSGNNAT